MTSPVWMLLRLFASTIISCNEISSLNLSIIPEVVIKGLNFSLECTANDISKSIHIEDPCGDVVICYPTSVYFNASCSDTAYIIDEEAKTVSMTKEAVDEDHGRWTCTHTTSPPESTSTSTTIEILQPLPEGNLIKNTTAQPNETISYITGDTFTVFYSCFTSTVKFKWSISSVDWFVVGKNTTVMDCASYTTGYMATQTVEDIWIHLETDVEDMLSVTILTENDYEIHPASSFDQVFFKGKPSDSSNNVSAGKSLGSVGVLGFGVTLYLLIIL